MSAARRPAAWRLVDLPLTGPMLIAASHDGLTALTPPAGDETAAGGDASLAPLLLRAEAQLRQYLAGSRRAFTLPLAPEGTAFQLAVWREMARIPWGATVTYGTLARRLGNPGLARAVGGACGANPLPIFLPCHRVTAAGGLGGYRLRAAGRRGTALKVALLELERSGRLPA